MILQINLDSVNGPIIYSVKAFDTSSVCGLVWNVNYVAYRCRTCALSPIESIRLLQMPCWRPHECRPATHECPPVELTRCAEFILSNLLYCLPQHFRSLYSSVQASKDSTSSRVIMNSILDDVQPGLELLNELWGMGTPMRKILVEYMISEEFYESKIAAWNFWNRNILFCVF